MGTRVPPIDRLSPFLAAQRDAAQALTAGVRRPADGVRGFSAAVWDVVGSMLATRRADGLAAMAATMDELMEALASTTPALATR